MTETNTAAPAPPSTPYIMILGRILLGLTVIAVAAFTLFVVRPWSKPPPDPDADDVAKQWNASISRLGITPVFPPQEDIQVGDVLAVVSAADDLPILGRAVALGHVDLRDEIVKANAANPIFADTTPLGKNDEFRHQSSVETDQRPPDDKIRLTLLGFPGVSISHAKRAGSAGGAGFFGFGASRDETTIEELRIPTAETYGIAPAPAALRLLAWCAQAEHKTTCSDAFARRLLAFTLGDEVLQKANGVYTSKLELQIVTRVYMTRAIEQRRLESGARALAMLRRPSAGAAAPSTATPASGAATTPEAKARDAVSAAQDAVDAAVPASDGASLKMTGADSTEFQLQQTFQRPLVFGFRSFNLLLSPCTRC